MSRIGRNQTCPCGSGQKFKKCCGRPGVKAGANPDTDAGGPAPEPGTYYRFRVSLLGAVPPIWRGFLLRANASFQDLHDAIQACGWTESHLWQFLHPGTHKAIAGLPDDDGFSEPDPDAKAVDLESHFLEAGDRCIYLYDFGDSWEHEVLLEKIEHRDEVFDRALLDGAGAFPPEDCGGIPGLHRLREFLETGKDPWEDDESLQEWAQGLRLDDFDLDRARRRFGAVLSDAPSKAKATPTKETREPHSMPSPSRVRDLDDYVVDDIVRYTDEAMSPLADRLGLVIRVRRASFTRVNAKIEVEAATVRDDGLVMDKHAEDFLRYCHEFGFEPEDLGRIFRCGDATLRVVGLRPRARQPVVCEQIAPPMEGSKRVRMSAASVRKHLPERSDSGSKLRLLPPGGLEAEAEQH